MYVCRGGVTPGRSKGHTKQTRNTNKQIIHTVSLTACLLDDDDDNDDEDDDVVDLWL